MADSERLIQLRKTLRDSGQWNAAFDGDIELPEWVEVIDREQYSMLVDKDDVEKNKKYDWSAFAAATNNEIYDSERGWLVEPPAQSLHSLSTIIESTEARCFRCTEAVKGHVAGFPFAAFESVQMDEQSEPRALSMVDFGYAVYRMDGVFLPEVMLANKQYEMVDVAITMQSGKVFECDRIHATDTLNNGHDRESFTALDAANMAIRRESIKRDNIFAVMVTPPNGKVVSIDPADVWTLRKIITESVGEERAPDTIATLGYDEKTLDRPAPRIGTCWVLDESDENKHAAVRELHWGYHISTTTGEQLFSEDEPKDLIPRNEIRRRDKDNDNDNDFSM